MLIQKTKDTILKDLDDLLTNPLKSMGIATLPGDSKRMITDFLATSLDEVARVAYREGVESLVKKIEVIKKNYKDHHCCRWGESKEEHPEGALGGYCKYELDHGFEMDEFLDSLNELIDKS